MAVDTRACFCSSPFGFCWCFVVARAFEAVALHWLSGCCSFAWKTGLWHLSCPPSAPVGLQGRLPLQKLAVPLHPRTWKWFARRVDFLLEIWLCSSWPFLSAAALGEAFLMIPLLRVRLLDSPLFVIPVEMMTTSLSSAVLQGFAQVLDRFWLIQTHFSLSSGVSSITSM